MVDSKRINATVRARAGSCRGTAQRIRPELPLLFHRVSLELGAMPAPFVGKHSRLRAPTRRAHRCSLDWTRVARSRRE
jgi:hypothetical protein